MKRIGILLVLLLAFTAMVEAKESVAAKSKKTPICLTLQAENGTVKQQVKEDGSIECIIKPSDVIRISSILLNGEDITNQLEKNKLLLPILTANSTLQINFESPSEFQKPVYNTIAMF